MQNEALSTL